MKIIIAGSRNMSPCIWEISTAMATMCVIMVGRCHLDEVFSGCAPGADRAGEVWAERHGIAIRRFPADWRAYGKAAGPIRNQQMVDDADGLIAFWDGKSKGTQDVIRRATVRDIVVCVYRFQEKC